jgi:lipopolysaccharide transport system permease protein
VLLLLNTYWICFLLAIICARFRDMIPIISSCVQIGFFVTPISWMPKLLDGHPALLKYNPFVYLLDIVRSPLLGEFPSKMSFYVSGSMAIVGIAFCFLIFSSVRTRLAFWVD